MANLTHGPLTAILFPVTECLHLPFEAQTYWIQHLLLVIVPFYLILVDKDRKGKKSYSTQDCFDWSWTLKSFGIWGLYHWIVLQGS